MDDHDHTTFGLPGYRIARQLGIVRGITVRSRSVIGNMGAQIQTIFGGNITLYTELCEHAREEAFDLMMQHAQQAGANAIIGMRYDANEVRRWHRRGTGLRDGGGGSKDA